jgi:3-oxoacyl-[acyl-carrier protein] reductase
MGPRKRCAPAGRIAAVEEERVRLEDRVACVTGGGGDLGRAMARAFAAEGARVVVVDLVSETAEETIDALSGDGHRALVGDVSDSGRVAEVFAEIEAAYGRLDVLVNNAGVAGTPDDGGEKRWTGEPQLLYMSDRSWTRMLEIHLNGAFFCTREALRLMLPAKTGSILNISSIAGAAGMGTAHYATAKAGLMGLTRSLARDLGPRGIRVNAICPGIIDSAMARRIPEPVISRLVAATPLRRLGRVEEIASTAVYLACDDSSFVTGQCLSPNGGIVIA